MLLTNEEVMHAMNLTTAEVATAMRETYSDLVGIRDAEFLGMDPVGRFIYRITYPSFADEGYDSGRVSLKFARKAFSKVHYLVGSF